MVAAVLAVVATVVIVRGPCVYPAAYLPRLLPPVRAREPFPPWQLRRSRRGLGCAAPSPWRPRTTAAGLPFPQRDLILVLTFAVMLATLVGQGLTLAPLVRGLGVAADGGSEREETLARRKAAQAALRRLDDLAREPWLPQDLAAKLRDRYAHMLAHLPPSLDAADRDSDHVTTHDRLRHEIIRAQRLAIIDLRNRGVIGGDALHRTERDLDLEELRTEI